MRMRSSQMRSPQASSSRLRSPLGRTVAALVSLGLLLSACGGDSVDHEALVTALTSQDQMSTEEATCVADAIFAEGKYEDDDMKKAAADITSVPGFEDAVTSAIETCTGA